MFLQRKGVVMNEMFTKVVELCVEASLDGNIVSATLDPALTALRVMTREGHV